MGTEGRGVSGLELWFHLEKRAEPFTAAPCPPRNHLSITAYLSCSTASSTQDPSAPNLSCCRVLARLMPQCAIPQQWAPSYPKSLFSKGILPRWASSPAFPLLPLLLHLRLASPSDRLQHRRSVDIPKVRVEGSCGNTDTLIRLRSSLVFSGAAEGAVACFFAACTVAVGQVLCWQLAGLNLTMNF